MKQRKAEYEFIRSIAMVMVIGVHTLANVPAGSPAEQLFNNILGTIFFLCNGLFFMLSGKFALASVCETWEDYKNYYIKKAVGLGVPILVYMAFRTMYDFGGPFAVRDFAKAYIGNVLGGYASSEYWFLYDLCGMLLLAPLLGRFFQRAGKKELLLILGIGLAFNTFNTYLPELGCAFGWKNPMADWTFFFILGYALEQVASDRKWENAVCLLGAVAFVLTVIQKHIGFAPKWADLAPTYALMASAAYLGLKRAYRPGRSADRVFAWIGRYSMAVYMLHMIVLYTLVKHISMGSYLMQVGVLISLTALIGLAAGFAVENTLVRTLQKLLLRLLKIERTPLGKKG